MLCLFSSFPSLEQAKAEAAFQSSPISKFIRLTPFQGLPRVMLPPPLPSVCILLVFFSAVSVEPTLRCQHSPLLCLELTNVKHTQGSIYPQTLGRGDLPLVAEAAGTGLSSQANRQVTYSPGGRATGEKELPKPHGPHRTRNHSTEGSQGAWWLVYKTANFMILREKSSTLGGGEQL